MPKSPAREGRSVRRQTRQSDAIGDALRLAARPLSPHEILEAARKRVPSLSLATVYRRIKQLCFERAVAPIRIPGQPPRYELKAAAANHHHHFHCRSCDRVFDLEGCPGGLADWAPPGFSVNGHDIVLYGKCDTCD